LLDLVGEVMPSTRPWPAAVHDLTTAQRAEVARALESDPHTRLQVHPLGDREEEFEPLTARTADPTRAEPRRPQTTILAVLAALAGVLAGGFAASFIFGASDPDDLPSGLDELTGPAIGTLLRSAAFSGVLVGVTLGVVTAGLIRVIGGPRTAVVCRVLLIGLPVVGLVLGRLAEREDMPIDLLTYGRGGDGLGITGTVIGVLLGIAAVPLVLTVFPNIRLRQTVGVVVWLGATFSCAVVGGLSGGYGWTGVVIADTITVSGFVVVGACVGGSWAFRAMQSMRSAPVPSTPVSPPG